MKGYLEFTASSFLTEILHCGLRNGYFSSFSANLQVNLCQKHSFLNQLTHNMTTDCSLITDFSTRKIQVQNMLCTKFVFCFCFGIQNNFCTQYVLNLYFLGDSMSYWGLTDVRMRTSEKDLPVAHRFGSIEFRKFVVVSAGTVEKIKINLL